ncbi:efflux transporter periplasmic adaptor subunit [Sulfuriferula sp. AH1]|uniref:efflux RND transporter periplasmic adaptor subunit n=1 Tax=Sulfuriferula sp. AH1 TaxID=1985873 RepID=UPI000B3B3FAD|nr:efflux RND transporter periplasmic adaptor subunit [Sulfuriferula sp. AH1]ARU32640.1 efflux transporter periplasmic adaptor subunit [Sulfuriferula sp. AH1]
MKPGKLLWLLAVLLVAGGGYVYFHGKQARPAAERYRMVEVVRGDLVRYVSANGTLNPVVLVNVGTQVSGVVKALHADYNQQVKAGQILLELDPALLKAQIAQSSANVIRAQAALKLAQTSAARQQSLLKQDYVARQDVDQAEDAVAGARAQLEVARAQLQRDKTNLAYSVIRSPVSGTVIDRSVDVGQTVAASFQTPTLFKIGQDLSKMQIDTTVAEADVGGIKVGQPAHFTVDAYPDRNFVGSVRQIRLNPTNQQNVVTYDVVVSVANPDFVLLPGMTAYVNIEIDRRNDALLVPNAALRFKPAADGDGKTADKSARRLRGSVVYLLRADQPVLVRIKAGLTDTKQTEVLGDELMAGDKVIVEDKQADKAKAKQAARLF